MSLFEDETNPARKYDWFGNEDKLRRRYGKLLAQAFRGEKTTEEESKEFDLLAEILSSDH